MRKRRSRSSGSDDGGGRSDSAVALASSSPSSSPPLQPPLLLLATLLLLLLSALPVPAAADAFDDLWSQYVQQTAAEKAEPKYETTAVRREGNLDHWDVPTAAAYLGLHPDTLKPLPGALAKDDGTDESSGDDGAIDEYAGHDSTVMFYAQWCKNCHSLAPTWDAVATHLKAGTAGSGLVMALFDCEKNARHSELCVAVGIKAYPTVLYVGSGELRDTDPIGRAIFGRDKSAGPMGASVLKRGAYFQGNWQYSDMVLDWVRVMKGLSSWHRISGGGPLGSIRRGIFGLFRRGGGGAGGGGKLGKGGKEAASSSLPVGIPPGFQSELRGSGGGGSGSGSSSVGGGTKQETNELERQLNAAEEEKSMYLKAVTHSALLIDGLLFSRAAKADDSGAVAPRDPFAVLSKADHGWSPAATATSNTLPDEHPLIVQSCLFELTVDYCNRQSVLETSSYVQELNMIPESDPFPVLADIEAELARRVADSEPYCAAFDGCLSTKFEDKTCRPERCPFENDAACSYVGSCFDRSIQAEYGVALGLMAEGEKIGDVTDWTSKQRTGAGEGTLGETNDGGAGGVSGWGIPV